MLLSDFSSLKPFATVNWVTASRNSWAAAQVADMSVLEVLESLGERLESLWSESPDVPERHRTLRAAIDWSYRLLNPPEQRALQQFAVFAGGWFRESVSAVCGPEGTAALRTLHRHSRGW